MRTNSNPGILQNFSTTNWCEGIMWPDGCLPCDNSHRCTQPWRWFYLKHPNIPDIFPIINLWALIILILWLIIIVYITYSKHKSEKWIKRKTFKRCLIYTLIIVFFWSILIIMCNHTPELLINILELFIEPNIS